MHQRITRPVDLTILEALSLRACWTADGPGCDADGHCARHRDAHAIAVGERLARIRATRARLAKAREVEVDARVFAESSWGPSEADVLAVEAERRRARRRKRARGGW